MPNKENEVGFKPAAYHGINLQGTYSEKMLIGYRWYVCMCVYIYSICMCIVCDLDVLVWRIGLDFCVLFINC